MEHRRVCCVNGVRTINSARRDYADRRLLLFHCAHLNGRGLRAEQNVVGNIESVLRVARRVIFGDIERLEVVIVVLDFGTFNDVEAHAHEYIFHFALNCRERVSAADLRHFCRERNVNALGFQLFCLCKCLKLLFLFVNSVFDVSSDFVCKLTCYRALLR